MQVEILSVTGWENALAAARVTTNKGRTAAEPSDWWKHTMLMSEHSPIRQVMVRWVWRELPYFVSVHLVRHKIGIEHFVSTQREDRTRVARESRRQTDFVTHECLANAQAIINISRKRLCHKADKSTIEAWLLFLSFLKNVDPFIYTACVSECVYRGFCPEFSSCGYINTDQFKLLRAVYAG